MNNDCLKTVSLFDCLNPILAPLFDGSEYPWEILPKIKEYAKRLIDNGIDGFTSVGDGILVGKNVRIHPSAVICGPCIIDDDTEIRPGAFIRGNVIIGKKCVIGNSCELKNAVLLDGVQTPHYNYVGDSVLGNHSHMGAGSVCSNLKSDGKNVVIHYGNGIETDLRKVGAFLGDNADVGCHCVLNPGSVIGKNTSIYPLTAFRGVVGQNKIVKSLTEIVDRV